MNARTEYEVRLSHRHYPKLNGVITITVTDTTDEMGDACFCNAHEMGCSRDYARDHQKAIRSFAAEHGATVIYAAQKPAVTA